MKLYEFLSNKYNEWERKDEIDFDTFIKGFLEGSFGLNAIREAFFGENDFLGEYKINYEVDHIKKEITLLFYDII